MDWTTFFAICEKDLVKPFHCLSEEMNTDVWIEVASKDNFNFYIGLCCQHKVKKSR
jgi:hypothetical protein